MVIWPAYKQSAPNTSAACRLVGRKRRSSIFSSKQLNANLNPILIHGGDNTTQENGVWRVPKRELVGVTQVALQTGRLKIAAYLPETRLLSQELQNFQVEISQTGFDSYSARNGKNDDLVLSLAMALWLAQNL